MKVPTEDVKGNKKVETYSQVSKDVEIVIK